MKRIFRALAVALTLALGVTVAATHAQASTRGVKPSIVFVHGAFADASGFADSIASLQKLGYTVYAPSNPLRGLATDADYIRTFLAQVPGPIVLVGHSYGGAVITDAATGNPNVKALVYLAAYALDEGESAGAANDLGGGTSDLLANLEYKGYPGAGELPGGAGPDADAYIKQASFHAVFAADVPAAKAAVMASSQRPITISSLFGPSSAPAWKTIPSWYLVAHNDKAIPPAAERVMAARAHAHTIEINSSHAVMVSHPKVVTSLVLAAAVTVH
jgi:pimeloyl-ACP methyl ester carboxylesterase